MPLFILQRRGTANLGCALCQPHRETGKAAHPPQEAKGQSPLVFLHILRSINPASRKFPFRLKMLDSEHELCLPVNPLE
jgi:hypothetical protein